MRLKGLLTLSKQFLCFRLLARCGVEAKRGVIAFLEQRVVQQGLFGGGQRVIRLTEFRVKFRHHQQRLQSAFAERFALIDRPGFGVVFGQKVSGVKRHRLLVEPEQFLARRRSGLRDRVSAAQGIGVFHETLELKDIDEGALAQAESIGFVFLLNELRRLVSSADCRRSLSASLRPRRIVLNGGIERRPQTRDGFGDRRFGILNAVGFVAPDRIEKVLRRYGLRVMEKLGCSNDWETAPSPHKVETGVSGFFPVAENQRQAFVVAGIQTGWGKRCQEREKG